MLDYRKETFLKRLQLASFVSIHPFVFAVELSDPKLFSHCQEHGVLVVDLLQDGNPHVSALVPRSVEMFNIIDSWGQRSNTDVTKSILDLTDVEKDPNKMEMEDSWKYLGDILSSDGKNDFNIKERIKRGLGAVTNICQTLKDLCLGRYFMKLQ